MDREKRGPTAAKSATFPFFAKCKLRLAFELPAAIPQSARKTLLPLSKMTLWVVGRAGERQSSSMAQSLNTSAARR